MKKEVKLSASQQDLLDAMRKGMRVHHMYGLYSHAFRGDNMKSCTATILALRKRGLVEAYDKKWNGCMYRVVQPVEKA